MPTSFDSYDLKTVSAQPAPISTAVEKGAILHPVIPVCVLLIYVIATPERRSGVVHISTSGGGDW